MRKRLAVGLSALLLSACMVGPDYERPTIETPKDWRFPTTALATVANTRWWQQFQDPALDALINEALANNKNIKIAAASMEQAAAVIMQTRSPLFPQFGYSGSAGRKRLSGVEGTLLNNFVDNPQNSYQTFVSASWEIDLWGRIRRLTESAEADWRASEAQ